MAYSFKNVLNQRPEMIKNTVTAIIVVVLYAAGKDPSLLEAAGVGFAIEKVLSLLYVEPVRQALNADHALVAFQNVRLEAKKRPPKARPEPPK
jgi:hypothetical protein